MDQNNVAVVHFVNTEHYGGGHHLEKFISSEFLSGMKLVKTLIVDKVIRILKVSIH